MTGASDRRSVLKLLGMAALGAGSGCVVRRMDVQDSPRRLAPVLVRSDRIIRTVVGLRPFRPSGFVVRKELRGDKTIVHNYGHGGGGVTLSWGTAALAQDEAAGAGSRRAAVLGAGAVGLATAVTFQRAGWDVTVYAKDLPPHTTSNVAGAQWSPSEVFETGATTAAFDDQYVRACRISYRRFQDLVGDRFGVRWIENFELSDAAFSNRGSRGSASAIRDLYPALTDLTPEENPFGSPFGRRFFTMLIEPAIYLDALVEEILLHGGRVEARDFASADDILELPEPVVVNCTGLGSRALFGDDELVPIQGQLSILLPQPEVDYIALAGELYMFPRRDGILLGSTYRIGAWDLDVDLRAQDRILAGHREVFDRLKAR